MIANAAVKHKLDYVKKILAKAEQYSHAVKVLRYDRETICPKDAVEEEGEVIAFLKNQSFNLIKETSFIDAVEFLYDYRNELDEFDRIMVEQQHRDCIQIKNLTSEQQYDLQRWNIISRVVRNYGLGSCITNKEADIRSENNWTHLLPTYGISNQNSTGRCWLYAALNCLRQEVNEKYEANNFFFSVDYLAFYDLLEKANYFLDTIIELAPIEALDRTVVEILQNPVQDAGQWHYFVDLVKKYGLVPECEMRPTACSLNTSEMIRILNKMLRKDAAEIRNCYSKNKPVWTGKCCSLRCKDCVHMIPYLKPVLFDVDRLISDIEIISQFCTVKYFSIVGGEPLTNPELYKLVDYIGQNPDITFCKLLTNGTIMPSQRLMESMKAAGKKFIVHVDQYPGTEETSTKIYQKIVSAGIRCIILRHSVFKEMHWKYLGGVDQKTLPEDMSQDIYRSCGLRGCYTLADGEFTACPRGITTEEIYDVPKNKWENINIRKLPDNLWGRARLATSIDQGIYKDYCRNCLGITELNPLTVDAGVQLELRDVSHE